MVEAGVSDAAAQAGAPAAARRSFRQPVADRRPGRACDLHGGARHHDRQRGPALYRRRHGGQRGRSLVGGDDLSGRQRRQSDGEPVPRPRPRPQGLLPDLPRALQHKLDPVRAGVESRTRSSCSASCKAWPAAAWCRSRSPFWRLHFRRRSAGRPSRCSASRWSSRRWSARRSAAGSPTIGPGAGAS